MVKYDNVIYSGVTVAAKDLGVVPATICHRIKSNNVEYTKYRYINDEKYIKNNMDKIKL